MRRGVCLLLAAALALPGAPALSQNGAVSHNGAFAADFTELQAKDGYVQQVGWKLLTGNASFCQQVRPSIGVLLQDVASYARPADIRHLTGIDGNIFVQSAVPGGPAAKAGLTSNMEILAIDQSITANIDIAPQEAWRRQVRIASLIDQSLIENGRVRIRVADTTADTDVIRNIEGVPACVSYFEIIAGSDRASANGVRIAVGRGFPGLEYPEDEFAAALAHELAHNLLGHPDWLNARGRKRRDIRQTEREADRLMPWLLANAGYDPAAAIRFMERWGPDHGGGLFRKRTHDGWDERAAYIAGELPDIAASIRAHGSADWSRDFTRTIKPN